LSIRRDIWVLKKACVEKIFELINTDLKQYYMK